MSDDPQNKHTRREFLHSMSAAATAAILGIPDGNTVIALIDSSRRRQLNDAELDRLEAFVYDRASLNRVLFVWDKMPRIIENMLQGELRLPTTAERAESEADFWQMEEEAKESRIERSRLHLSRFWRDTPVYQTIMRQPEKSAAGLDAILHALHETIARERALQEKVPEAYGILYRHGRFDEESRRWYEENLASGGVQEYFDRFGINQECEAKILSSVTDYIAHYKAGTLERYVREKADGVADRVELRERVMNNVGEDYQPIITTDDKMQAVNDIRNMISHGGLHVERMQVKGPQSALFRIAAPEEHPQPKKRFPRVEFVEFDLTPNWAHWLGTLAERVNIVDGKAVVTHYRPHEPDEKSHDETAYVTVQTNDETLINALNPYVERFRAKGSSRPEGYHR